MPAHPIFSEAHREFVHQAYMRQMLQPAAITTALNDRFGTNFKLVQVQRLINSKWSKRRKVVVQRVRAVVEKKTDSQLVKEHANKNAAAMERFAKKTETLADKALDMANNAGDARSMAAAAAAAKSAITMFRLTSGIDGVGTGGPRAAQFNFNFGNLPVQAAGAPPVEVVVTEAPAESRDDGDDEDDFEDDDDASG
jgi:hypothetical protein